MSGAMKGVIVALCSIAIAACSSVSEEGGGGSGGTSGTGGTAGTGGGGSSAPTVTLTATPVALPTGTATKISWDVADASSCDASQGLWSGPRSATGGSEDFYIYEDTTFGLTCSGPGGSGSDEVDVSIDTSQLLLSIDLNLYLVKAGDPFNVSITVFNPSTVTKVEDVLVTVLIPRYVIIDAGSLPDNARCTGTGACVPDEFIEWELGAFDPGTVQTVRFTPEVAQDVPPDRQIDFQATASATGQEDLVVTEMATEGESDLSLQLSQSVTSPQKGDTLVYTVGYQNTNDSASLPNVVLTLTLPGPVVFRSATNGGTVQDGVVSWSLGQLAPSAEGTVQATVEVNQFLPDGAPLRAAASGTVGGSSVRARSTRVASVGGGGSGNICQVDADCTELEICDDVTKQCTPHVLAYVDVNPGPVRRYEFITVKVTVSNPGPYSETVDVDVPLPISGFYSVTSQNISEGGTCDPTCGSGGVLRWNGVNLQPGQSELLWFRAQVTNSATVAPDGREFSFTANLDSARGFQWSHTDTVTVDSAQPLKLSVQESRNPAVPGQDLTYTIHYGNRSPTDRLDNVQVTVKVDGRDPIVVPVGRLQPGVGGTKEVTITLDDATSLPFGSQLRAVTELVNLDTPEEVTRAVTQTPIAQTPLLATVEVNPDPIERYSQLLTTITVSNPSSELQDAEVVMHLPLNFYLLRTADISEGGSCVPNCDAGNIVKWTILDLAPGESELLWIRPWLTNSASNAPDGMVIPYTAEVSADGRVPIWAGSATRVNDVQPLKLHVEESRNPAMPGQDLTYTIHYGNQNPTTQLDNVQVTVKVDGRDPIVIPIGQLQAGAGGTRQQTITLDDATSLPFGSQLRAVTELVNLDTPEEVTRAVTQTPIAQTPLLTTVEVSPDPVQRYDLVTVSIDVENPTSTMHTADVVAHLPLNFYAVTAANISGNGVCEPNCDAGNVIRWKDLDLAQDDVVTLFFRAQLTNSASNAPNGKVIPYDVETRVSAEVPVWSGDSTAVLGP